MLSLITSQVTVVITESSSVILYNPDMYPVEGATSLHDFPMIFWTSINEEWSIKKWYWYKNEICNARNKSFHLAHHLGGFLFLKFSI